ncbi:FtsX-like permease family protein [Paraclostridium sordellii]|uniref:FtsX-like permease family protein n=1 Tax=Paraclostridium sordellii TaxID=1505 RepID=UPI001C612789|nr:FtsX-like permease family protein [Paeniclostridium sordellii]QYE99757.1 FtsX-like permease family protein [Paeniclostridium sordellii]
MFEFKLALKYLKKNKIESLSIIACLVISITLILGVDIGVNSLYSNQIEMAREIAGSYEGTLTTNSEKNIEKLKKIDGVYNVQTVRNLGEFIPQNGLKTKLYTFNEDYLKSLNYKLTEGRFPQNENEIVIDQHSLSKFSKDKILNKEISGLNKIKYNSDGVSKIYSEKNNYKVVGFISKVDGYYELQNNINGSYIDILTFIKTSKDIVPNKLTNYETVFDLKNLNEKNLDQKFEDIRKKYDPSLNSKIDIRQDSQSEISNNGYLDTALRYYQDQMSTNEIVLKVFLIVIATFTIANVLYIIIKKITNQIGQLRVVGMSNKKVVKFYLIQMLILFSIGSFIGVISSILLAKFSMDIFTILDIFDVNNFSNVKLNIPYLMVIRALLIILFILLITILLLIRKSLKQYPIDILNKSDKLKYKPKKNKTIIKTLLKNNLLRNKIKTIMSIVIISFSGFMIIQTTSTNLDYIRTQNRKYSGSSANKYDYVISHYDNADTSIKKVDISKIKNVDGVKDFDLLNYNEGNLIVEKNKVNESYINMVSPKYKNSNNQEILTSVIGVDDVNNIKEYVKEGNIKKLNESENGYINIAVTNSFYDDKYKPAIKDLKIGDIFSLKIESKDINGNCYYENVKCRVVAMLDSSYLRIKEINGESGIRICMDFKNLQQITNNNYNQRISFNTSKNSHSKINKLLEDINKDNDFLRIFNRQLAKSKDYKISYYLVVMLLVLFSALFNIYITISLNLKNNVKEFSILRAIGISKKSLKKLVVYESIIYPFLGSIVSIIFISIEDLRYIKYIKEGSPEYYIKDIYLPPKEGFIYMAIVVLFGLLIGYIKSKSIDKMEIIEGINEN